MQTIMFINKYKIKHLKSEIQKRYSLITGEMFLGAKAASQTLSALSYRTSGRFFSVNLANHSFGFHL